MLPGRVPREAEPVQLGPQGHVRQGAAQGH